MLFRVMRVFAVCLALSFLSSVSAVSAAEQTPLKVGVMNIQKIMTECDAGKLAQQHIEAKHKELQASLEKDQKAMQALNDEIAKKQSVWSKDKLDEKSLELQKMKRDLKAKVGNAQSDMKQLQEKEINPLLKTLESLVKEYGAKHKYSMIFDSKTGVVYFDSAYDVSDELIKELNQKTKAAKK